MHLPVRLIRITGTVLVIQSRKEETQANESYNDYVHLLFFGYYL
ncbi:hypothetical protein [Guptibacillus hwajinpoensis]|nr:hypothetical protein [Alkalihalobacillus macyae]